MSFEDMQSAWRSQGEGFKMTIDSSLLLHEVKRNHRYFSAMIFWRDFRECFVALLLVIFFMYAGVKTHFKPTIFLIASMLWIGVFIIADRLLHKRKYLSEQASLSEAIKRSLQEVSHQIWLLENVFWWYLLPPAIGMVLFYGAVIYTVHPTFELSFTGNSLFVVSTGILFAVLVFWGVYKLNQVAVRKELLLRKRELEELLASLSDEA